MEPNMAKTTEEVQAIVTLRITYEKKKGAREKVIKMIRLGQNTFGARADIGGFSIESIRTELPK